MASSTTGLHHIEVYLKVPFYRHQNLSSIRLPILMPVPLILSQTIGLGLNSWVFVDVCQARPSLLTPVLLTFFQTCLGVKQGWHSQCQRQLRSIDTCKTCVNQASITIAYRFGTVFKFDPRPSPNALSLDTFSRPASASSRMASTVPALTPSLRHLLRLCQSEHYVLTFARLTLLFRPAWASSRRVSTVPASIPVSRHPSTYVNQKHCFGWLVTFLTLFCRPATAPNGPFL